MYKIILNITGADVPYTDNTIFVGTDGTVKAHVNNQIIECQKPFEFGQEQMTEILSYIQSNTQVVPETDPVASAALNTHIDSDEQRWQTTVDSAAQMQANILDQVQKMILGTSMPLDYANPQTVVGTNGFLTLGQTNTWQVPYNGAIVCSAGGALTTSVTVMVMDGSAVTQEWISPTYVLGLPVGGDKIPSNYIPVEAGNIVTTSGLLTLGSPISVIYYPNKI